MIRRLAILLMIAPLLAACGAVQIGNPTPTLIPTSSPAPPTSTPTPTFTPEPSATVTLPPPSSTPRPTPTLEPTEITLDCELDSAFVDDVTIPDDSRIERSAEFVKTWRIRNTGSCQWDSTYRIVTIDSNSGIEQVGEAFVSRDVPSGDLVDISVTFRITDNAPSGSRQRAEVQLEAPNGERFGTIPFVQVIVR